MSQWGGLVGSLADEDYIPELTALIEHALFNHLVRTQQDGLRNREAQSLGGKLGPREVAFGAPVRGAQAWQQRETEADQESPITPRPTKFQPGAVSG
jgi:hypothetical protein